MELQITQRMGEYLKALGDQWIAFMSGGGVGCRRLLINRMRKK
jgi:hypothetical protein